jgi:hypothetical protein
VDLLFQRGARGRCAAGRLGAAQVLTSEFRGRKIRAQLTASLFRLLNRS